jgi:O-acetyl-ADP-ribose deacetylase (regulator of RNase III)
MNVKVVEGDITQVEADAIGTCVNTGGMWFGGVDRAIYRVAGQQYHAQLGTLLADGLLKDGRAVTAKGDKADHKGQFNHVVFVGDDLTLPLEQVVLEVLGEASDQDMATLALPAMRCGVMAGVVEPTTQAAVDAMFAGVEAFKALCPESPLEVTLVVYADPETFRLMNEAALGRTLAE